MIDTEKRYHIVDTSGNYYKLNEKDNLVVARNSNEATLFSLFEANSRIGSGRKARFYNVIEAVDIALVEDDITVAEDSTMPELDRFETPTMFDGLHNDWESMLTNLCYMSDHMSDYQSMGYTMNTFRKAVKDKLSGTASEEKPQAASGTQASIFQSMTEKQAVAKIGELCQADSSNSGILASISAAQFILESGYGKSELAQGANNCFGMKKSLSGNTWSGSTWDGKSIYTKKTKEEYTPGVLTEIIADFRKYPKVEDSIADHSAYLLGAMNGSKKRYDGLAGCTDYKKAVQLIKDGGYATSSTYVEKLCSIIEKWNLTQFDAKAETSDGYYRVRKSWADSKSQLGAYKVLANAKKCADKNPGYTVYDPNGKAVYPVKQEIEGQTFLVKVSIDDLNIRKGPGTNHDKVGVYTGKGVFTIIEVADGPGAIKWGLLKSYADKRNGWISLDYAERL